MGISYYVLFGDEIDNGRVVAGGINDGVVVEVSGGGAKWVVEVCEPAVLML